MSESPPSGYDALNFRDFWEILRLPVLFALTAIAATWAVWYFTSAACSAELAEATGCNAGRIAHYINLDALNKMMAHAVIAAGGGGLWSYAMITRERKAREAAEKAREAAEKAREEERKAREEERKAREEERKAREEERKARESVERQLTEERERADEERRQLLAVIERLTEGRNGGSGATQQ